MITTPDFVPAGVGRVIRNISSQAGSSSWKERRTS